MLSASTNAPDPFVAAEHDRRVREAWRLRKAGGQVLGTVLVESGSAVAKKAGQAMQNCGRRPVFDAYELANRQIVRRLIEIKRCRGPLCPQCQPARSKRLVCDLVAVVDRALEQHPGDRLLFITLTIKNCSLAELIEHLDRLNEAYRKFTRLRRVRRAWRGWHRTIEITRNPQTGEYHPHIHVLVQVPARYFWRNADLYMSQAELAALWARCLGVLYAVSVDIRRVDAARYGPLRESLKESCKYVTTALDLFTFDGDAMTLAVPAGEVVELFHALRRRRLVSKGGIFRTIARELKQTDVDDPNANWDVEEPLPEGAVYIGREFWCWDDATKQYLITIEPAASVGWRESG